MFCTIDNLEDYVFGTGLMAGIAPISGDAGGDVGPDMSFDEFKAHIEAYLDQEDGESRHLDLPTLRTEYENEKTLHALYSEFKSRNSLTAR